MKCDIELKIYLDNYIKSYAARILGNKGHFIYKYEIV